jgi:hypothetical protein
VTITGEGTAVVHGVTHQEVFDLVLDPAQYTKADTKMIEGRAHLAWSRRGGVARVKMRWCQHSQPTS